jgi:hypothetical protein
MSRSEDFDNGFWDEPDVFALGPEAKLVYIWSWTNKRCHFSGIYKVPLAAIVFETKHTEEAVQTALVELEQACFLFYDGTWMFVRTRVKRIRTRTVQMCKAIAKDLVNVPHSHPYLLQLLEVEGARVWRSKSDTATIASMLSTLTGVTRGGRGSDSANGSTADIAGSYQGPTSVVPRTGTGTGTGTSQGRGVGRGSELLASFPDVPAAVVKNAAREIAASGEPVTVESIRAHLEVAA